MFKNNEILDFLVPIPHLRKFYLREFFRQCTYTSRIEIS